jgi:hypothetical protein
MNKTFRTILYIFFDLITAALAWTCFYYYRKSNIDSLKFDPSQLKIFDDTFFVSVLAIPFAWVLVYYLIGS